jgi:serine protease
MVFPPISTSQVRRLQCLWNIATAYHAFTPTSIPDAHGPRFVNTKNYLRALDEVSRSKASVLNLSLGGTAKSRTEEDLFKKLAKADIFVAAAMGNSYPHGNPTNYPAAFSGVCGVAASNEVNDRASFSNTGRHTFIAAPGTNILSTVSTQNSPACPFQCKNGTSMATPYVAAAAALVRAKHPQLTARQTAKVLEKSAVPGLGQKSTRSQSHGYGLLNLEKALSFNVATL